MEVQRKLVRERVVYGKGSEYDRQCRRSKHNKNVQYVCGYGCPNPDTNPNSNASKTPEKNHGWRGRRRRIYGNIAFGYALGNRNIASNSRSLLQTWG